MQIIANAAGTGTPTLGSIISIGSNLQAIAADRTSNIWVSSVVVTDTGTTNTLYVVAGTTVSTVTGLTFDTGYQLLSGAFHAQTHLISASFDKILLSYKFPEHLILVICVLISF